MLTQSAHVAKSEGKPATPTRISRCRRISDQCDAVAIRVSHPRICAIERSDRTSGFNVCEPFGGCPRLEASIDEVAEIQTFVRCSSPDTENAESVSAETKYCRMADRRISHEVDRIF